MTAVRWTMNHRVSAVAAATPARKRRTPNRGYLRDTRASGGHRETPEHHRPDFVGRPGIDAYGARRCGSRHPDVDDRDVCGAAPALDLSLLRLYVGSQFRVPTVDVRRQLDRGFPRALPKPRRSGISRVRRDRLAGRRNRGVADCGDLRQVTGGLDRNARANSGERYGRHRRPIPFPLWPWA